MLRRTYRDVPREEGSRNLVDSGLLARRATGGTSKVDLQSPGARLILSDPLERLRRIDFSQKIVLDRKGSENRVARF